MFNPRSERCTPASPPSAHLQPEPTANASHMRNSPRSLPLRVIQHSTSYSEGLRKHLVALAKGFALSQRIESFPKIITKFKPVVGDAAALNQEDLEFSLRCAPL